MPRVGRGCRAPAGRRRPEPGPLPRRGEGRPAVGLRRGSRRGDERVGPGSHRRPRAGLRRGGRGRSPARAPYVRRHDLDPARARQLECLAHVVGAALARADEADARALGQPGDLVDELQVAGSDEHGHDRDPAGGQRLRLVGVEGRRRDEVVVELVETLGQVVDERALSLDHAGERVDEALRVVAGIGVRAFGEEDTHEWPGSLALRGSGECRGGDLVSGEAGVGGATKQLGDDPGQRLIAASLRRTVRDVRPGSVTARDVAAIGKATVDRADGVRVHAEGGTELTDRRQPGTGQQAARIDLVGELPVDLGRDGDVGIACDVEAVVDVRTAIAVRGGVPVWVHRTC